MSILLRPEGDALAKSFGKYMTHQDLKNIKVNHRLDVLCTGGVHFVAKVVRFDDDLEGRLHIPGSSEKEDYIGPFRYIYIAAEGTYSASEQNLKMIEEAKALLAHKNNYVEQTRYDADFFSKPYRENGRKRKALDPETELLSLPDKTRVKRVALPANLMQNRSTGGGSSNSVITILDSGATGDVSGGVGVSGDGRGAFSGDVSSGVGV